MAEYIDKKYLDRKFQIDMMALRGGTVLDTQRVIDSLPTADVIERVEYDKLLEENKQLKRIISDKVNEDLKCAFEVKELRSKIDNAIEEMERIISDTSYVYTSEGVKLALKILKRNIGE